MDQMTHDALGEQLDGTLLTPADPGYDKARTIWNAMIEKRPKLIAACRSTADVVAAVRHARSHSLEVSVRGGGHNVAGNAICEGGLMIDLSPMNSVDIDPQRMRVAVGGGCTLGDVDRATQPHGLAVPSGIVSETGVGGLALGGGVGWLVRKYGMTCDNLLAAEVVTANGDVIRASAEDDTDLFWALRGGGGNFGVVTKFEFQAHPVRDVTGGMILHPRSAMRDVMRAYRDVIETAPLEITAYCAALTTPDGTPVTAIIGCYCGDAAGADAALQPLRSIGTPIADMMTTMPRIDLQTMFDGGFPYGNRNYWKSTFLDALNDDAIDVLVEHAGRIASPLSALMVEYYFGGPSSEIGETETAFAHRGAAYDIGIVGQWVEAAEDATHMQWARDTYAALAPHANGRIYANLMGADQMTQDSDLRAAFGANYERLVTLKRRYDPDNFFHLNQNIKP